MAAEASSLDTIFCAAVEIVSAGDRVAYLAQACGDDHELRARVIKLVEAHFRAGKFLERPVRKPAATDAFTPGPGDTALAFPREGPGTQIGPYKLLQQIGEGGMGSVWLAEQQQPVQRTVALKLIKPGMDSAQVIARFEAERQALALMDHPNIARVLDAGTIEDPGEPSRVSDRVTSPELTRPLTGLGSPRPYFVMELVKGVPITRHCDEQRLGPRQRLELFVSVCHAVQHAHQKGIIHRDIKPSNVLVARYDGKPVPKVIDFGIAKATGPRLTERTLFTEFGAVVGKLEYMSPEQAELNQLDIDTRSDIYSLGVLLYELLTGSTPLERKRLKEKGLLEVLRLIREEEPPTPSTRLRKDEGGRMKDVKKLPAHFFSSFILHPSSLQELDWIVMKCLEKDRNRRYETANGLAQDIQRYLRDEPVLAGPPSRTYRVRKFLKRHRGPVLAAAVVALALLGGMVGTTTGMVHAQSAREAAVVAEGNERDQRQLAEKAREQETIERERAEREMRIAQAVREFLQLRLLGQADARIQANTLLESGRSVEEAKENPTIRELLDRAARELTSDRIETQFPNQPLVQAEILQTIGDSYRAIGQYAPAIAHLKRALGLRRRHLGADHRTTLATLHNLAFVYHCAEKLPEAIRLYGHVYDRCLQQFGPDDLATLNALNRIAMITHANGKWTEAIRLYEQVRDRATTTLGLDHVLTQEAMIGIALVHRDAGKRVEAVRLLEKVCDRREKKLGSGHPSTLYALSILAWLYQHGTRRAEAVRLLEQVRDQRGARLGPDHPETLDTLNTLAGAYRAAGKVPDAIHLYEQVLERRTTKLGPDHVLTLVTLSDLGLAYRVAGQLPEAIRLLEHVRDKLIGKRGSDHLLTLTTLHNLAEAYYDARRLREAIHLEEQVRDRADAKLGPHHPLTLATLQRLAVAYQAAGKLPEAIRLHEEVRDRLTKTFGPDDPDVLYSLAKECQAAGKLPEAIRLYGQVRDTAVAQLGPDHPETLAIMHALAGVYQTAGNFPEAAVLLEQVHDVRVKIFGSDNPLTLSTLNHLGVAYFMSKQLNRSVPAFEKLLEIRKEKLGLDHPDTLHTMLNLAINYRAAGRLPEARSLLEDGCERSRKLPGPLPPDLSQLHPILAEIYDQAKQFDRSEPLYRESLEEARRQFGADHLRTAADLAKVAVNLLEQKKYAAAQRVLQECLAIRTRKLPDNGLTFATRSLLGSTLLAQKKYAAAEPLLLTGYQGMKQREKQIPERARNARLGEALVRLVRLYEAWGKQDEAAKWRKQWEALKSPGSPPAGQSAPPRTRP